KFGGLNNIITAHPTAAAVVGIAALALGLVKLNDELERQRIAENFGDIVISLEEIDELVSPITADSDKVANAFENNKQKFRDAQENFQKISEAVDKTAKSFHNASIKQDVEGFAKQLDEFVESALELNSATYDTSGLEALFMTDGEIDDEEQRILDQLTDLGGEVSNKIKSYAEEIHKITQAAIDENRQLTESEIENLESLYKKLAELTAQQSDIKSTATWERLKNGDYTADSYAELMDKIKEAQEQDKKAREEIEQANYEKIISVAASMRANGKSESEIEAFKDMEIKKVKENLKEMELKSLRYQRDVVGAWGSTVFKNVTNADPRVSDEDKKLLQAYFDAMLNNSEGADLNALYGLLNQQSAGDYRSIGRYAMDTIRRQFGVDFMGEWNKLNEAIGDAGGSVEDFYDSVEYILRNTKGLEVDDLIPKLEEFKDRPEEYTYVLNEWIEHTDYDPINIKVELDTTEADKWLAEYTQKKADIDNTLKATEDIFGSLHDYSSIWGKSKYEPSNTAINPDTFKYSPFKSPEYYPTNKSTDNLVLSIVLDGEEKYKGTATGNLTATQYNNDWNVTNGR
ncbi:MAG: hypothetical protein K2N06_02100, partial [Oscillospiraceae bacterium]|nr:hypothetical protein [Oscillospiraceae bacterium]